MYVYTTIAFLIVFSIALAQSLYVTWRRTLVDQLKSDWKSENMKEKHAIIG